MPNAPETEISRAIAETRKLVRTSGGASLLPRLREAEAHLAGRTNRGAVIAGLREAEAMYRALDAPDPATRLASELGSCVMVVRRSAGNRSQRMAREHDVIRCACGPAGLPSSAGTGAADG